MVGIDDIKQVLMSQTLFSHSSEETFELGTNFGALLQENSIVCFFGDLGAGKTTFIKGLAAGIEIDPETVSSPTFTYLNIYSGKKILYHFDLYRLRDADEFLSMGFDEFFDAGGICCLEWSEKIATLIPEEALIVNIVHLGGDKRKIEISHGAHGKISL